MSLILSWVRTFTSRVWKHKANWIWSLLEFLVSPLSRTPTSGLILLSAGYARSITNCRLKWMNSKKSMIQISKKLLIYRKLWIKTMIKSKPENHEQMEHISCQYMKMFSKELRLRISSWTFPKRATTSNLVVMQPMCEIAEPAMLWGHQESHCTAPTNRNSCNQAQSPATPSPSKGNPPLISLSRDQADKRAREP